MAYQLIAFDMDGTLLDDGKRILPETLSAIREATDAGKIVAIGSGRSPRMIEPYRNLLPDVHYAICISGASILDLRAEVLLMQESFDPALVRRITKAHAGEDCVLEIFSGMGTYMQRDQLLGDLDPYGVGEFRKLFEDVCTPVDDINAWVSQHPEGIAKYSVHARSPEIRARVMERIRDLPIATATLYRGTLELSPTGISKGTGLSKLCKLLGIPVEQSIAVGDSGNDLEMIRAAGLGVAMANASPEILDAADVVVADNNHDGCAEAIRTFLLS